MGCQGFHRAALALKTVVQLKSKHHVGQLALAIGAVAVVALGPAQVVPADGPEVLGAGGHGHDPGIRLSCHQWQ